MGTSDTESVISYEEDPIIITSEEDAVRVDDVEEPKLPGHETPEGAGSAKAVSTSGSVASSSAGQISSEKTLREHPTVVSDDEPEYLGRQFEAAGETEGSGDEDRSYYPRSYYGIKKMHTDFSKYEKAEHPANPKTYSTPPNRDWSGEESRSQGRAPTSPNARRNLETPLPRSHRDFPVPRGDFLRIPGRKDRPDSPGLDLEVSSALDEPPPSKLKYERPPMKVARRSLGTVQPGDADFRRSFAQEQGQDQDQPLRCVLYTTDIFGNFMVSEMDDGDRFWDLVVLTSNGPDFWITTCGQYVADAWPRSVGKIRELFDFLGANNPDIHSERRFLTDSAVDLIVSTHRHPLASAGMEGLDFSMTFDGFAEPQADMVEAVTWLFSVLQQDNVADSRDPLASVARWEKRDRSRGGASRYKLTLHYLVPLNVSHTWACWTDLVPRTACAVCYWTKNRPAEMKGLEISFELLCYLAGLQYEAIQDGGLVLFGKNSLVYPVRQNLGCVQWHFQAYNASRPFSYQIEGKRLLIDDLRPLRDQPRHFLGLWSEPRVTLGTSTSEYLTVDWSIAKELSREVNRDGLKIGGAVTVPKVLTLNWTQTYKIARSRRNQYMVNFEADLYRMIDSPVILYSPSEKRGWMVSFVSVLLHLTRTRAELQEGLGFHIPACELRGNGGQAAFDCLRACYRQPLKKAAQNEVLCAEEQMLTVEDYVKDVLAAMEVARRESCRAKGFLHQVRERIIGFELADIARMKPQLRMKQHSLDALASRGWAPLLDEVQLTFFYDGVRDPIIPSETSTFPGHCGRSTWRSIPIGFNLLTVSLPCLLHLVEDRNGGNPNLQRLTQDFFWHCPGQLFEECKRQYHHSCSRLQELATLGKANSPDIPVRNPDETRAVVFRYADGFKTITEQERNPSARDIVLYSRRSAVLPRRGTGWATSDSGFVSKDRSQSSKDALQPHPQPVPRPLKGPKTGTKATVRQVDDLAEDASHEDNQTGARRRNKDTKRTPKPARKPTGSSRTSRGWIETLLS